MASPAAPSGVPADLQSHFRCPAGFNTAVVDEEGDIFLCHNFMKPEKQIKVCSIYDKISLSKQFFKCTEEHCECPLYKYDLGLYRKASLAIGEPVGLEEAKDVEVPPYDAWLHWLVTQECFLSCEYCPVGQQPFLKRNIKPIQVEKMMAALKRSGLTFRISFTGGGEPFAVPNITEACVEITKEHYLSLNTNLVRDMRPFVEAVDSSRVIVIVASLHLQELERTRNIDKYIENFLACREVGMPIYAAAVGIPNVIPDLPRYRDIFSAAGIDIGMATYSGTYEGKVYPESYTDEDLAALGIGDFARNIFKIDKEDGVEA
jgi:hypothetical protein